MKITTLIAAVAIAVAFNPGEIVEEIKVPILPAIVQVQEETLTYDAFAQSNIDADGFDAMLEGTPLEGYGHAFAEIEEEYGVNGLFALSVCNLESSLGKYCANTNNFFGFTASYGFMSFDTPEAGIRYFGKLISSDWYAGKTIDQIAKIYCPPNPKWASDVRWLMEYNFKKGGFTV